MTPGRQSKFKAIQVAHRLRRALPPHPAVPSYLLRSNTMKKLFAVVLAVFALNAFAADPAPAADAKPAEKSAKKAPAKKGEEKKDEAKPAEAAPAKK